MSVKILNFVEAGRLYQIFKDCDLLWLFTDPSLDEQTFLFLFFSDLEDETITKIFGILFGKKFINMKPKQLETKMIESFKFNQIGALIKQYSEIT